MAAKDNKELKIQPRYRKGVYSSKIIPELTLSGIWLEAVGFKVGARAVIEIRDGELIIKPA